MSEAVSLLNLRLFGSMDEVSSVAIMGRCWTSLWLLVGGDDETDIGGVEGAIDIGAVAGVSSERR